MTQKEFIERHEALQKKEAVEKINYDQACHDARVEHRRIANAEQDRHDKVMAALKSDYYATLEAIRADRNALRLEWAESEEKRRIEEQKS